MTEASRPHSRMLTETLEAPAAVARQLAANAAAVAALGAALRAAPPRFVVTGARGSSDHAATFAKYLIETRLGLVTASAAPSVATLYDRPLAMEGALFIAVSQSGRSPDLLRQTELATAGGARTLALVNDAESPLAAACDHVLPLHAGPETSVAATKSYVATLSALVHLVAGWPGYRDLAAALDRLPERLESALGCDWTPALEPLAAAADLLVVGRGLGLGIAQEAALKLKETCGLHAEAFSGAELMHGPVTLVGPGYPLLVFSPQDETRASLGTLVAALREIGAATFVASPEAAAPDGLPLPPPLHPQLDLLPAILAFYRLVEAVSRRRGRDPDRPRHLRKVTQTR